MSRRISKDYDEVCQYMDSYSVPDSFGDINKVPTYKAMHKKLYGYLVLVAEYKNQGLDELMISFLNEAMIDLLTSYDLTIHCIFKPAKLELRCAIENFIRGMLVTKYPEVSSEKNVYSLFDIAKSSEIFSADFTHEIFEKLHSAYSELCAIVHGDPAVFRPISSISSIVDDDQTTLEEFSKMYCCIAENMSSCMVYNNYEVVDKMHPENKKDLMDCLSKTIKKEIIQGLFDD